MRVHFKKSIAAQIFGSIAAFVFMLSLAPNVVADTENYIERILRITVNYKLKEANEKIDEFLKDHGKLIQTIKDKKCNKNSRPPCRKIRVPNGQEKAWISELIKSRWIKKVKRVKQTKDRLPEETDSAAIQPVANQCANQQVPFFSLTSREFDNLESVLKNAYQHKCGDCVQLTDDSPVAKKFSIVGLNKEVIKDEDWLETLEITFLQSEQGSEWTTIVSGQYAPSQWKGQSEVPTAEFKDIRCQYQEQLNVYAADLKKTIFSKETP
jgi:hypothetical protein